MQNKKIMRLVESFIMIPVITLSTPFGSIPKTDMVQAPQIVLSEKQNITVNGLLAFNQVMDQKTETLKAQAEAIDAYFEARDMPLAGTGMVFATEADKNDLDYRLLPAIAVRESTGGKFACKKATHSFMGWGSCKINFKSDEEAIRIIAQHLGGNHENTDHYYEGKTIKEILQKYNPPSVVPRYAEQVMKIMNDIGDNNIVTSTI